MKQTVKDILETPLNENQSVMAIMISYDDPKYPTDAGDLKVIWDSTKEDEVASVRKQFKEWKAKGYMAYSVRGKNGEKGEVIGEFDPEAKAIIFAPPMQGGLS